MLELLMNLLFGKPTPSDLPRTGGWLV